MKTVPHKLLCATTSYPTQTGDAAGRFVALLNHEYAQQGWAPEILCPRSQVVRNGRCPLFRFPLVEVSTFGPVFQSGGAPDWLQKHPFQAMISVPPSTLSMILGGRWMKSTAHMARVTHWLVPSTFCFSSVTLAHAHGGDIALLEKLPFGAKLAEFIEQRVQGINFVSLDLKERYESLLGRSLQVQTSVLPMGVEAPSRCERSLQHWQSIRGDQMMITTVGRLTEIKGHMTLLKALAQLDPVWKNQLIWVAAGDGPLKEKLRVEAQRLKVPLQLVGHLNPQERDALLDTTDLFILPSLVLGRRSEGSPVALMEALSAGCRVIATHGGGVKTLLQKVPQSLRSSIKLCAPNDEEGLAHQLEESLQAYKQLEIEKITRLKGELKHWATQWHWSTLGPAHAQILQDAFSLSSSRS